MNMSKVKEQEEFIENLLHKMTLEEKIGQLNQVSTSIVGGFDVSFEELIEMMTDGRISKSEFDRMMAKAEIDYHEEDIRKGNIGSFMLNNPEKANELQKIAVEESRLGIPMIFALDVIHGFQTIFPIPLAEACSFNDCCFEKTAVIASEEAYAHAVRWTFAPMLDIARDARWGRISESAGEDPYLCSRYARAKIRGFQGDGEIHTIAACAKHFAGYGACEAGRDYNTVSMAKSMFYNSYLPPFAAAVSEGADTVMAAFNDLNGIPCTMNSWLMKDVLRKRLGFDGLVVSDANAIKECISHGYAEDEADAAVKALNAGMEIDMGTSIFLTKLRDAVQNGDVKESAVNEAVRNILRVKARLGLFENPYISADEMRCFDRLPAEHLEAAQEAAEKSAVLLKNDFLPGTKRRLLPLAADTRISLVGALADMPEENFGAWSVAGDPSYCISLKQALEERKADFRYFPCCAPEGELNHEEAAQAASYGDVIVAILGETASQSGEASSRSFIGLSGHQQELLKLLQASGKPVVLLLQNGRPLALSWENENIPAILECWQLGTMMGPAVSRILFGEVNPSGKLSASFPRVTGQCPIYYNHPNTGRPGGKSKFTSRYLDTENGPLYPFGYGLSYTEFTYSDFEAEKTDSGVHLSVAVENAGNADGAETIQFYMQDVTASLVRPVRELRGYQKVFLKAGEKSRCEVCIPQKSLGFYDEDGKLRMEKGNFRFYAGGSSEAELQTELMFFD